MRIELRGGRPSDAEACGSICYRAFKSIAERHNFPPDFPEPAVAIGLMSDVLARADVYSLVAEVDGRVVGSNFLRENAIVASIGPITVDPDLQNASIGKHLMEDVLRRARERRFAGVRLVQAAYHGRSLSLYTKLGFSAREPLSTLQGPAIGWAMPGRTVRPASESDLEACNQLCAGVHGHDRGAELLDAIRRATASVVEQDGRITGYATMVGFFGHAIGDCNEDLKAVIGAATAFPGPGLLVPTRNGELLRWCLEHGLRIVQPMMLMSIGLYSEPRGAFLPSIRY